MPKSSLHLALQVSIRLIKWNDALDGTVWLENANRPSENTHDKWRSQSPALYSRTQGYTPRRLIDLPALSEMV
jgi:hypothetical protein